MTIRRPWRAPKVMRTVAIGAAMILGTPGLAHAADAPAAVPEVEENDVATLAPLGPHWAFITDWMRGGVSIVNGDTGKLLGTVHTAQLADFAIDPGGRFFYVSESIWTRGNRGTRQDLLTVYDARSLKILSEIPLKGRLLINNRPLDLTISPDGRYAFVFNLDPSSSVQVVDLARRRFLGAIEVPGCGLAIATAGTTTSLCSNGSMATVAYDAKMQGKPERTPTFFSAEDDPIFDNSAVDRSAGKAIFLSYSGLVYEVGLGAKPAIGQPWSLQEAAGLPKASTAPLLVGWLPGGRQPIAFNRTTGKAYVLMHMGEYWTQKVPASELWEVDVASRKVLWRKRLDVPVAAVAVSQDAAPLLFLVDEDDRLIVMDAAKLEQTHVLAHAGNGVVSVAGN